VSKSYPKRVALKDISITVPPGKIIGIVGGNGSGKSTLLKLMAGLSVPTSGSVTVNGETASRRSGKIVAYSSELGSFYPVFTVREAMRFQAAQYADFNLNKAEEIMQLMKLDPGMKIKALSKGNRGRLQIVLTLAREAPYILMGEPLSGLDPMVWLIVVALPIWTSGQMDDTVMETVIACLLVVLFPFVIPWRYVFENYVKQPGNRWNGK
jgi:ABC-type multidrug transport system, ATPase component